MERFEYDHFGDPHSRPYERFTDRARKVMQLANYEAQLTNHECIGAEHILLGLMKEGEGVAAHVLKLLHVDIQKVRVEIDKIAPPGQNEVLMGTKPMTADAQQVIENAMQALRDLNHNYIGTEHLLIGLMRQNEGTATDVLAKLGVNREIVIEETLNLLGHGRRAQRS
jgi:ATP-dependent Clp protease ATP-binding subunit ClpC